MNSAKVSRTLSGAGSVGTRSSIPVPPEGPRAAHPIHVVGRSCVALPGSCCRTSWRGPCRLERRSAPPRQRHQAVHRAVRGDRLPPVLPHGLRHGAATLAYAAGCSPLLDHHHSRHVCEPAPRRTWRSPRSHEINSPPAHANGPGRGVRGRVGALPGGETPGQSGNALCPRQDSNLRHPL